MDTTSVGAHFKTEKESKEMQELDLILSGKSKFNNEEIAETFNINQHVI
jgi:DNA-binding CsgD family transcriptional regulator